MMILDLAQDSEQHLLRALLESSPDYIFFKDRQSRFILTNAAHARLLMGLDNANEAIGKTDFDLFTREEAQRFYDEEQAIMETGRPAIARDWSLHSSTTGQAVWLSEHKLPIRDESGQVIGLLGLSRDITELKQSEAERERLLAMLERSNAQLQVAFEETHQARLAAEKADQVKTRLLANVSHELRTPLNIILSYAQDAEATLNSCAGISPQALRDNLERIRGNAEHQLRVINDLLDLSRAEIDELDLCQELLDPRPLLEEAFQSMAHSAPEQRVTWRLQLPDRLPLIRADPVRLRQVLLNLLSNARKFTDQGEVVLGAQGEPSQVHFWVQDTGAGIAPDRQERVFEPFVTGEHAGRKRTGIGLGLAITRHLVTLHNGSISLESEPGRGSTFHVYLPVARPADTTAAVTPCVQPALFLISAADQPSPELVELSQCQGVAIQRLRASDDLEKTLLGVLPAAVAWDLASATEGDWALVRRLRHDPRFSKAPFILYGQAEPAQRSVGLTGVLIKPTSASTLLGITGALRPQAGTGPILIVDDDLDACEAYQDVIAQGLPGFPIRTVNDGAAALAAMQEQAPSLVLLDLMMPKMDGFDVLDRMRADPRTQTVPVVVLTCKVLNRDDIRRIERHTRVVLQSKGMLTDDEIVAALHRSLFGAEALPPHTSALVKRAVAYLHQNYARCLERWEIAEAVGVSENYLTRVFEQELGISLWDYLNRFRVSRAKELFRRTQGSVKSIAGQVGFKDPKYFTRVFHKLTGLSPMEFREQAQS
jgi:PAS domain S-box-containing protein